METKAKGRFHMQKNGLMVEHRDRSVLESIRKQDERFRHARISQVIQCLPSQIEPGTVYLMKGWIP